LLRPYSHQLPVFVVVAHFIEHAVFFPVDMLSTAQRSPFVQVEPIARPALDFLVPAQPAFAGGST